MTISAEDGPGLSRGVVALMAGVCGLAVATLYYAQPLIGLVAPDLGLPLAISGLIVTAAQIGFAASLLLLVPLGDIVENRSLIVAMMLAGAVALIGAATATTAAVFLAVTVLLGITATAAQMVIPLAAHWARPATRGRTLGTVTSGLVTGILLARPAASLMADAFGWRAIFWVSAAAMVGAAGLVWRLFPRRRPEGALTYGRLIASLGPLLRHQPVLQRRILYQGVVFAAFILFWTAIPLELSGPPFGLSQKGLALFALAGAGGAVAAPLAGRAADRGWTRGATALALLSVAVAGLLSLAGALIQSLTLFVLAAIMLDAGAQTCLVLGQRAIHAIGSDVRSRLNALYVGCFFFFGAVGSALATPLETATGWWGVAAAMTIVPCGGLLIWRTDARDAPSR